MGSVMVYDRVLQPASGSCEPSRASRRGAIADPVSQSLERRAQLPRTRLCKSLNALAPPRTGRMRDTNNLLPCTNNYRHDHNQTLRNALNAEHNPTK